MRALTDGPEPRRRRIHAGPDRDPWAVRIGVAGRAQECRRRGDALLGVIVAAEERDEHRHELIADELVDGPIVVEDDACGDGIEPIEELAEG